MTFRHKKHRGIRFLFLLTLILTLISIGGILLLKKRHLAITFTPADYSESNEALANPYIGWYHCYEYVICEDASPDLSTIDAAQSSDTSTRLCLVRINLKNYAHTAISDRGLSDIRSLLGRWATIDKQILLQFCYDRSNDPAASEPSDPSTIYRHMEQVADIVNDYAGHIYQLQGVFSDMQGEDSAGACLADLTDYYASLTDRSLYLGLHDSDQYLEAIGQNSVPPVLYSSDKTLFYRIGLFDDAMSPGMADGEAEAIAAIASFAPCGGSVSADASLRDATTAIGMLFSRHISYLNADQDETILESWKNQTYHAGDAYSGLTLYDYMTTHLGYRYVLRDVELSFNTWKDQNANLRLYIENVGSCPAYMPYDVRLLMRNRDTEEVITLPLDTDNRSWGSAETVTLDQSLALRDYEKGSYSLYLLLQDPSTGEVIKLGNTMPLTSNGYLIGSLIIR